MLLDYSKYLRNDRLPHIWCPGCGAGIILKSILRAIDKVGWKKDDTVIVSGIGCSSRAPGYMDFNTLHTTHGRALAFATGIKMYNPKLNVIVITGDGDATAIGGNHFIHASRRNINLNVILFNNYIYGMTGGQCSPTTPAGKFATTSPYGNIDPNFNISGLAAAAGASFVAKSTTYQIFQTDKYIEKSFLKDGFSLVEVMFACPTSYGRRNKIPDGVGMMEFFKDNSVPAAKAKEMKEEELKDKIVTGILVDRDYPEYTREYREKIISRAQQGQK